MELQKQALSMPLLWSALQKRPWSREHTGKSMQILSAGRLVLPGQRAYELIASAEGNDPNNGGKQAQRSSDTPLRKDEAEIPCIPVEQHLQSMRTTKLVQRRTSYIHAALIHSSVIHAPVIHAFVNRATTV